MPTLIYVHGRGLKPPAEKERKAWLDALNTGLRRLTPPLHSLADDDHFKLAYWSNLFYPAGATEATGGLSNQQLTAVNALVGKFWQWRGTEESVTATDADTKEFEDNFVRDVVKFFGLGYAEGCAEPLRTQLASVPAGDPVMLVSHSFGTVLAYEVLIQDATTLNVPIDTWVTMGTPLNWAIDLQSMVPEWQEQLLVNLDERLQPALHAARDVLTTIGNLTRQTWSAVFGQRQEGLAEAVFQVPAKQFPPNVQRWFNIYDPRDPVACAGGLAGSPKALAVGGTFLHDGNQRAFDVTIRNEGCPPDVVNADMRAHMDYTGYGQCAQLAQLVADFWARSNGGWV